MSPQRFAQCFLNSKKYGCTIEEEKESNRWLIKASVGVVIAAVALIGVTVGPEYIRQRKQQQQEKEKITEEMQELSRQLLPLKEKPASQRTKEEQELIDTLDQEISRLTYLRGKVK